MNFFCDAFSSGLRHKIYHHRVRRDGTKRLKTPGASPVRATTSLSSPSQAGFDIATIETEGTPSLHLLRLDALRPLAVIDFQTQTRTRSARQNIGVDIFNVVLVAM
jgi:hypothetical protein